MVPTILDLPDEVLFYIFTLVHGDIKKNPFFRYHDRLGGRLYTRTNYEQSFYSATLGKYLDMTYVDTNFDSRAEPMFLPSTISSLCMVSRDFNNIAKNLWEPFYITNIRKNNPYKRIHPPDFYRQKVYKIMKKYYENVYKVIGRTVKYNETMEMIKSNNASLYLDKLKSIMNGEEAAGGIDNARQLFRVSGLLQYGSCPEPNDNNVTSVYLDLSVDYLINYRRKAKRELDEYSLKHDTEKRKLEKNKKVLELL